MDIRSFLNTVCNEIKYKPVRAGISEELEEHINEIKEEYIADGMEPSQAEEKAVLQMGVAEEIGRKLNKIHKPRLDWKLILLVSILTGCGFFVTIIKAYSVSTFIIPVSVRRAVIYTVVGVLLSIGIYFFDYRKLRNHPAILYGIATAILVLAMIPGVGMRVNGAVYARIINLAFPATTVALPLYLISFIGFITQIGSEAKIKLITLSLISLVFMLINVSLANLIILACSYLIVSTIKIIKDKDGSTRKLKILYGTIILVMLLGIAHMFFNQSFRWSRLIGAINPETDPKGTGYVQMLQRETLQKAKIIGEAENMSFPIDDSILNINSNYTFIYLIGKCGLLVAGVIFVTVILASFRIIKNAKSVRDEYGKFLVIGMGALFILQSFVTIFMNVGIGIQADVNMPFVTYGGAYFLVNVVNIAVILSVYRRKDIIKNQQYFLE